MATFEIVRTVPASLEATFAAVGDLAGYGDYIAMTVIDHDSGPVRPGWRFTGRTGPAPLRLVDRMQVTEWDPPHGFAVTKLGPVLDGWARVRLRPAGDGTLVEWREEIVLRPPWLGRAVSRLTDPVNRWLFGRALDRMAARAAGVRGG